MNEPQWVYVTEIKGWVREHDPATQSGLVPKKKYPAQCGQGCGCQDEDAFTTELDVEDFS